MMRVSREPNLIVSLYNTVEQDPAKELTKALNSSKIHHESNVKSYSAGKALSLRGWKTKEVTELNQC